MLISKYRTTNRPYQRLHMDILYVPKDFILKKDRDVDIFTNKRYLGYHGTSGTTNSLLYYVPRDDSELYQPRTLRMISV